MQDLSTPMAPILLMFGLAAVLVFAHLVSKRGGLGLAAVTVIVALDYEYQTWPGVASIGGISITVPDIVIVALSLSLIPMSKPLTGARPTIGVRLALVVLIAALSLAVFSGAAVFGLGTSVNAARPWIYVLVIAIWLHGQTRASKTWSRDVQQWLFWTAIVVFFVATFNIAVNGLGTATTQTHDALGEVISAGRPLTSHQALFLPIGATVAINRFRESRHARYVWITIALLAMATAAQHRSVWAAALVMLSVMAWRVARGHRVMIGAALISGAVLVAASWSWFAQSSFGQALGVSASSTATYEGRQFDWQYLIGQRLGGSSSQILFGQPFGTPWDRPLPTGQVATYIPHNWYVSTGLQVGAVGLIAALAVLVHALVRSRRVGLPLAAFPILIGLSVFFWAYNMKWFTAPALVWCIYVSWNSESRTSADRISRRHRSAAARRHPRRTDVRGRIGASDE